MWAGLGKGTLRHKNWDIGSRSKSSEKFVLNPIFDFCRISLSNPYSTSMQNFKCQNDLKDPKRAVKWQATFFFSHSRSTINYVRSIRLVNYVWSIGLVNYVWSIGLAIYVKSIWLVNYVRSIGLVNYVWSIGLVNYVWSIGLVIYI